VWLGGAGPGAIGLPFGSLWGPEPDEAETKTGSGARSPGRAEYIGERRRAAIVFGCWRRLINPASTRLHHITIFTTAGGQLSSFNLSQCSRKEHELTRIGTGTCTSSFVLCVVVDSTHSGG
jgi:hypothetical protein